MWQIYVKLLLTQFSASLCIILQFLHFWLLLPANGLAVGVVLTGPMVYEQYKCVQNVLKLLSS